MRGRTEGQRERILTLAHQAEALARQKVLKPLAKYLDPPKSKHRDGASALLEKLRQMKARQDRKTPSD